MFLDPTMLMTKSFTITPNKTPFYQKNENTIRFDPIVENLGKRATFYIDCFSTTDEPISGNGSIQLYIKAKECFYVPYHRYIVKGSAYRIIFRLENSKTAEHVLTLKMRYRNQVNVLRRPLYIQVEHDYSTANHVYDFPMFGLETLKDIEWMNDIGLNGDIESDEDIDKYFN